MSPVPPDNSPPVSPLSSLPPADWPPVSPLSPVFDFPNSPTEEQGRHIMSGSEMNIRRAMTVAVADLNPRAEHTKQLKVRDLARIRSLPARAIDKPLPPVRAKTIYADKPLPPKPKLLPPPEKPLPVVRKPIPTRKPLPSPIQTNTLPTSRKPLPPLQTYQSSHPHPLRSHPSPEALRSPLPNFSRPLTHPLPPLPQRDPRTKKPRPHTMPPPLPRHVNERPLPALPHIEEDALIHVNIYTPPRRVQVRRVRFMGNRLWLPIVLVFTPTGKIPRYRSSVTVSGLGDRSSRGGAMRRNSSTLSNTRSLRRNGSGVSKTRSHHYHHHHHRRPKPQPTNRHTYERRTSPSIKKRRMVVSDTFTSTSSNTETVVPNFRALADPMTPIEDRRRKVPAAARDTRRDGQCFDDTFDQYIFEGKAPGCSFRWVVQEGTGEERRRKSSIV